MNSQTDTHKSFIRKKKVNCGRLKDGTAPVNLHRSSFFKFVSITIVKSLLTDVYLNTKIFLVTTLQAIKCKWGAERLKLFTFNYNKTKFILC